MKQDRGVRKQPRLAMFRTTCAEGGHPCAQVAVPDQAHTQNIPEIPTTAILKPRWSHIGGIGAHYETVHHNPMGGISIVVILTVIWNVLCVTWQIIIRRCKREIGPAQ